MSSQHYGTLERGINSFSLDNILKLCDFYNVTVMSILGELRKNDRKRKKECEKLISQIEELGDEHKEVVAHMVKFYRQLEKKSEKEESEIAKSDEAPETVQTPEKKLLVIEKRKKKFLEEDNEEDDELVELIENLENEIKQKEAEVLSKFRVKKTKRKASKKEEPSEIETAEITEKVPEKIKINTKKSKVRKNSKNSKKENRS